MKKIYLFVLAVIALVPLGLISENPAWGEWENEYYEKALGFIPKAMQNSIFEAPIPDYATSSLGDVGSYYFSAFLGVLIIFGVFFILKKVVKVER